MPLRGRIRAAINFPFWDRMWETKLITCLERVTRGQGRKGGALEESKGGRLSAVIRKEDAVVDQV